MTPKAPNLVGLTLLGLPTLAYGAAVWLRNRYYDRGAGVVRADIPVLSVGNLTVGGTGKTPIVSWLAREILSHGRRPAVVSRGYRGRAGRGPVLVSDGSGPLLDSRTCGDEPYLLARTLPGVIVVAGSDRAAGTRAAQRAGADVVILDDGFQHRRLARDLDLLLLDATNPFGNYRLLPTGVLREPLHAIARSSAVLITRARPGESLVVIERVVRRHHATVPILRAGHRSTGFVDTRGGPVPAPRRALAFCGIGNPGPFRGDLEAAGLEVVELRIFRDHHRFTPREIASLADAARRADATLVTTEKDLVRLPQVPERLPLLALRIEAVVHDREALVAMVRGALGRAAA